MELFTIVIVLPFLLAEAVLGNDNSEADDFHENNNPWQHEYDVNRRHARDVDGATPDVGQATAAGSHGRRHQREEANRAQRQRETVDTDTGGYSAVGATAEDDPDIRENCTHCAMREISREYRLAQIRHEILAKLRLESPPNITDKRLPAYPEIKKWLDKIPDSSPLDDNSPEPMVKIISMINIAHPPPPDKIIPLQDPANICFFEFQADVQQTDIVSARLGVFVRQVAVETQTITMFLIYKVKQRKRGNILIKRKRVTLSADGTHRWYRFDVDAVVKSWVRSPASNFGLQIMIFDDYGQSLAIVNPENEEEELYKPYIELTLRVPPPTSSRDKRTISLECEDEQTTTTACCRYPMVVDFSGFGWDWILAPKKLEAHYCAGECNHSFLSRTHQHIVEQAGIGDHRTACCVPQKYNVLRMVYYSNKERIQMGVVHGIVVDSCGCA